MSSQRKFTFAISSPDEFLVYFSDGFRHAEAAMEAHTAFTTKLTRQSFIQYTFK